MDFKKIGTKLVLLVSGMTLMSNKSDAQMGGEQGSERTEPLDPVGLRPLNRPGDNLFAQHRSHSSHGSHRSSSGGSIRSAPAPRAPATPAPDVPGRGLISPDSSQPTDPGRGSAVSPKPKAAQPPKLTTAERRTLQIMRVQIQLTTLGLYTGAVDGVLSDQTKEAIKRFQIVKGIEADGLMSTDTLNALGVPAVQ